MSIHEASNGHTDKAAAARGGESVIPAKAKAARGKAQLGASMEPLSSAAANVTHKMETDLPEDDVTVIAEAEETDYESG